MNPDALMAKASVALNSAQLLLEAGDVDGACNRIYYAMFDAARAALLVTDVPTGASAVRTHSGLINAFGQFIVTAGHIPVEHGRALNRLHELRLIADYRGDSVEPNLVRKALLDGKSFLTAITTLIKAQ